MRAHEGERVPVEEPVLFHPGKRLGPEPADYFFISRCARLPEPAQSLLLSLCIMPGLFQN